MIKQYFKQAFFLLKENKLLSFISIAGTAMTIAMIMVTVILFRLKNGDYKPEVNRSRTLYVQFAENFEKGTDKIMGMNFELSLSFIRESLYPLKDVEAVTAMSVGIEPLSSPEVQDRVSGRIKYTDTDFWKFFDFTFLEGGAFSETDFASGIKSAVICEEVARKLFHTTQAVGKTIHIAGVPFQVCGVMTNISGRSGKAGADVYVPYTTLNNWREQDMFGNYTAMILASSPADFDRIHQQVQVALERYNNNQPYADLGLRGQPYTHFQQLFFKWDDQMPHVSENVIEYVVTLLVLLLVPAVNLSGLTLSRMQKRMEEIGIRKSFGATRRQLTVQVLTENLLLTLIGGLLGVLFSYGALFLMKDWLLNNDKYLTFDMLVSPSIFLLAFLFCLVLNLLSAGIPAWNTSRKNIVDALH